MKIELRFGRRALGVGIFYHAEKRILYLHPMPFVAVLVIFGQVDDQAEGKKAPPSWYEDGFLENGLRARRHLQSGQVEILLWKAGEQGHIRDHWHRAGEGHRFMTPTEVIVLTNKKMHRLKCHPVPFQAMRKRVKTFEYRKDDRGFDVGDLIYCEEWDPALVDYTGQKDCYRITYKLASAFGVPDGYCVLAMVPAASAD